MHFTVDNDIFEMFPELSIGVVIAHDIDNQSDVENADAFLQNQIEIIRNEWSPEKLETDPRILPLTAVGLIL